MAFKYLDYPLRVLACLLALAVSSAAYPATFSNLYIFGDSLSDTTAGFSDGVLWPIYFAPQVGVAYDAGDNYAVAGTLTTHLASQVSSYQADNTTADPDALYVVWSGSNDIGGGYASATDAANNVINAISTLSSFGAEKFLVPYLGDLGAVPAGGGLSTFTDESILFNSTIDSAYSASSNVLIADVFGFHHNALADPSAFGLTNASDSCLYTGADCSTYLIWDDLHPTTVGHSLIADEFVSTVTTVVPIPAAVWLFGSGLLGLVGVARRRNA